MNSVILIGRLTRDPDYRLSANTSICTFSVAIDRGKDKNGNDRGTDFPRVTVFGRQADSCDRYLAKGRMVAVQGRIQTGSYTDKDGKTVYTTDVVADRVQFIDWGDRNGNAQRQQSAPAQSQPAAPRDDQGMQLEGFQPLDDEDLPF